MELLLPPLTKDLTPVQQGWLKLAGMKVDTFAALEKQELEIQALVKGYETMELTAIQEAMKSAKSAAAIAKDQRLQFTNMLNEKLVTPSMLFEKRNDELIAKVVAQELVLRTVASKELEKSNNLNKEKASLEAHIKNEYSRIGTLYRNALTKAVADAYVQALKDKVDTQSIPELIAEIKANLCAIVLEKPTKFVRTLVSDEDAKAILATIPKYNSATDLQATIDKLETETFGMYAEDLKNADVAAEAVQQQAEEAIATNDEEWNLDAATNTLMAQASPLVMTGGPTVKKVKKIQLEDTEEFAMNVLATFIKNWPVAKTKLGTKSWTKLVDPFVKALDKMETEFPNFKYDETCK